MAARKPKTNSQALANVDAELAKEAQAMADRIGSPESNAIKIKQNKTFALPDGRVTEGPLDVIIVDFVYTNNFYKNPFDKDNIEPPACFAISPTSKGMIPSNTSPEKQADECVKCPNNAFGSKGKGKACNNNVLLAVLPADATEDTHICTIKVSPTAIRAFDGYVNTIAANFQKPPIGVITELYFDPGNDYPSLRFGKPQPNPNYAQHFARREEARKILMAEPDVSQYEQVKPKAKPRGRKRASA